MSWSGLEAMHCSMSSPTSKDTSTSRGLGWHRTFAANLWSDEINLCAALDNCVSVPYTDANFEKGNGTCDLVGLDDNAYAALPLASPCSGVGPMRTLLEQGAEFDDFLPSLEQKMLESLTIAEDGQALYQHRASNLQPFLVSVEQQDDVKNESLSEQEHSRLCPDNVASATDFGDAALAGSIRSYFESLLGLNDGEDTEQSSAPMNLWEDPTENLVSLVSVAKRHGLPEKRRRIESFSEIKKTQPSWQMLAIALASSCEYLKDPGSKKDLSHGLVGGNINVRKTRLLRLQRSEPLSEGSCPLTQVRLVMCDREKGAAIDAGLQYKDNQYCDLIDANPHDLAFTIPNMCVADLFTKQLCALLEKEGYELMDDEFQSCDKVLIDSACMDLSSLVLDSPSARENVQIPDEASVSDCMLLSPVAEHASFEITEARVGSSSRTLEINSFPALPFDLQSQSQGQVPWPQAHPSQFDIPLNVEPQSQLQQWEQMAIPRRKVTLPPAAWGA